MTIKFALLQVVEGRQGPEIAGDLVVAARCYKTQALSGELPRWRVDVFLYCLLPRA